MRGHCCTNANEREQHTRPGFACYALRRNHVGDLTSTMILSLSMRMPPPARLPPGHRNHKCSSCVWSILRPTKNRIGANVVWKLDVNIRMPYACISTMITVKWYIYSNTLMRCINSNYTEAAAVGYFLSGRDSFGRDWGQHSTIRRIDAPSTSFDELLDILVYPRIIMQARN